MKNQKKKPEDLVTEHIVVTKKLHRKLWELRILWHCGRLNDVIEMMIYGDSL